MIKAKDAIAEARRHIGTPYGTRPGELDCINLIKKVIRTAPGGVPNYTTAGTNSLWKSRELTKKYQDLVSYQTGIDGAKAGMIAFKADGEDFHHAGIVTDVGTVIHSSSTQGGRGVVETPLTTREGWTHLAIHRYIEITEEEETVMYKARVDLDNPKSYLNMRNGPGVTYRDIGDIPHGAEVDVLTSAENWSYVRYNVLSGYVATEYLERIGDDVPEEDEPLENPERFTAIIRNDGTTIRLEGSWRVAED